jgi:hypothetical protein
MPSSISNSDFERPIPAHPWRGLVLVVVLLTLVAAGAWEMHARALGYAPTLNDSPDLWAKQRHKVQPDSIVIIGDSRPHFDLDLDELEHGLGRRPIQLALDGSCAFPILADFAADEQFHGTVICSVVPLMFFAPGGPLLETSEKALKRYHTWTWAQRASLELGMLAEEHLACMKNDDLTLSALLTGLPIANRPGALIGPAFPPYFDTLDRDRRARMTEACARPGPVQDRVKYGWLPLFTPPPPPTFVPKEAYLAGVNKAIESRFKDTVGAVAKIRARGGKVIFVRFPNGGELAKHEDKLTPRVGPWDQLIKLTGAPGIYFQDYPELASFECPEWSHLSAPDSIEFTKRLVPHLKKALGP